MTGPAKTIGLLYPGEMGAALARLLRSRGHRVVTTLQQRSAQTARRCHQAGIVVLDSLADVIATSDAVFSLVSPGAAQETAQSFCELAHLSPAHCLYVDINSIGPQLAADLAEQVQSSGRGFVDAAINGLAKNLTTTCTLFLSGPRSAEVQALLGGAMKLSCLGDQSGRASAMKMLLSAVSKGACALFVETALTAHRHGMLDQMIEAYEKIYPGVWGIVERMLPTYPQHAGRRVQEMLEVEQTIEAADVEPRVLGAIRALHESLAETCFTPANSSPWTVASVIGALARQSQFEKEKCHGK